MADCEPPSFSLGFDFGFESEPRIPDHQEHSNPPQKPAPDPPAIEPSTPLDDDEDEFGPEVADSDIDTRPYPPRVFKRLRRGKPQLAIMPLPLCGDGEEDIEDFSSQEDILRAEVNPSAPHHVMCSSSKIPLHGQWKTIKNKPVSTVTASASVESGHNEKLFWDVTVSPLRKFQLIDSDSDDTSTSEEVIIRENHKQNTSHPTTTGEQIRKASGLMPQGLDLWKDFCPVKSVCTPVLDELCEEYFRSLHDKKSCKKMGKTANGQIIEQSLNVVNPLLPAHRYFLHHDPRVRKLVRNRLFNFSPLGIDEDSENQQSRSSFIDYMGQFGSRQAPERQATQHANLGSSKRGRNKVNEVFLGSRGSINLPKGNTTQSSTAKKGSNKQNDKSVKQSAGKVFDASQNWVDPNEGSTSRKTSVKRSSKRGRSRAQSSSPGEGLHNWVDPRSSAGIREDSGKRGAQPVGQSVGHWFTGSDGRKVYVNKNGQELTGQIAYRQYKKDRGAGSNKSKRKTSSRRKKA
ncbi:hypothetical protein F8388_008688 [Cannabis sativa]|uniref:Uncharacterized protein n=1 Tax=Cannabis sativa TaxID=3483 RepID=A0A7J6HLN5_CANSA|nr:hypothetical protein F8388_008688 [Cannabis sativa]